jgi:PAS domain S-box-containing protein
MKTRKIIEPNQGETKNNLTDDTIRASQVADMLVSQNEALLKLNRFSIELSAPASLAELEGLIANQIKELSGAQVTVFSDYDPINRTITTNYIELEPGLLDQVVHILGENVSNIHPVVNDEMYREMTTDVIWIKKTLSEASFGAISQSVGDSIQALIIVDRFIGIAYLLEGNLYGTSLLGMRKNQPDPQRVILENYIHLTSSALQRTKAHEALRVSEDKFRHIFDYSNVGKSITQISGEIQVNLAFCRLLGYSQEELQNKKWQEITHPDDIAITQKGVDTLLSGEKDAIHLTKRYLRKDGSIAWVDLSSSIRRSDTGKPLYFMSTMTDLTERKEFEETLLESDRRYHLIFENSGTANTIFSKECRVILQNSMSQKLTVPMDARGKTALEIFGPEQGQIVTERMQRVLNSGVPEVFETKISMPIGTKWIYSSYFPLFQEEHELVGIQVISQDITVQKQAEIDLIETSERMTHLLANSPTITYSLAVNHKKVKPTWISENIQSIMGFNPGDPINPDWWLGQILPPDRPQASASLKHLFDDFYQQEYRFVRKDGQIIWIHDQHRMVFDAYQQPAEVIGTWTDITERKQAEEALYKRDSQYRTLVENSAIGIYRTTPEGAITLANPSLVKMLGYQSFDELAKRDLGKGGYEPGYPRQEFQRRIDQNGKVLGLESAWTRKDGSSVFIRESASIVRGEDGEVLYYEGTVEDITERKKVMAELNEERNLLRTLIDNLPDRVYVMDALGRKIISNTADWQASGGKSMEDIIGKTDLETYPSELAKEYWALEKAVIDTGIPVINREEGGFDPLGNQVTILSSKIPLLDNKGNVVGLVGIGHDITEQKMIEEKIKILSKIPDESPNPILRVSKHGTLLYANEASAALLAVWKIQDDHKVPDEWQEKVKNVFDSGLFKEMEVEAGEKFYSIILAPILDAGYVNLYGRDITLRKRGEQTLVERNEEIEEQNVELARLYHATGALISNVPNNLKGLATSIVDTVLKEFGHTNCSLIMVTKDSNELVRLAVGGLYIDQVKNKKLTRDGSGIVPQVISTGKLMNVGDVHAIPDFIPNWDEAQSELTIPLKIENEVIGVIDIQSSEKDAFNQGDGRVLSIFAERAALALEHGRLNEELKNHIHQLSALRTVDMAIASSMDIRLTLDILLENLVQNIGVDAADVLIYTPLTQTFQYSAGRGFHTQALHHTDTRMGDGYAGQAALSRQIVSIPDLRATTGGLARSLAFRNEGFISYVGAPLLAKGQVKGVLELFHREPFQLDAKQRTFLEMLAGQAAIAIENSQLFENLQSSNSDLILAYDETIEGWSRAMDLRDEETEGHSLRVIDLTLRMASLMDFKPDELLYIRRGALLHDIGKIGIPDSILLKPGPLTDEEWVIMRRHPQLAHDMLKPILYLGSAIDIPWCHHEKWDGTGYPRGLKGENIPLTARIFAVVDVWDALLSDRPYRKAWSTEKARTYIQEQAGMHFDPQVVDIFLKQVSTIG